MNQASILEAFDKFSGLSILIIGDVILDSYCRGVVKRISPEAPVPVLEITDKESRLGGAANVALNIQGLGAKPILCSVIGNDEYGRQFSDLLHKSDLTNRGIIVDHERQTTVKTRMMSGSNHMLRMDEEQTHPLSDDMAATLTDKVLNLIDEETPQAIIFEDYDKGCLSEQTISSIIDYAKKKGIPTAVDPKKNNFFSYSGVSLFKPNLRELKEGLNLKDLTPTEDSLSHAFQLLKEKMSVDAAFFTLSEHGVFITDGKTTSMHPAHPRNIADVSGAGDTVISVAACALAASLDLSSIAFVANLAGGIVCQYPGVKAISFTELFDELKDLSF